MTPEVSARELTVLAWRRTALRWIVVAVVATRIFSDTVGAAVVAVAFVTIGAAAWVSVEVANEFSLPDARHSPVPRLAVLVAGTALLGVAALFWALTR